MNRVVLVVLIAILGLCVAWFLLSPKHVSNQSTSLSAPEKASATPKGALSTATDVAEHEPEGSPLADEKTDESFLLSAEALARDERDKALQLAQREVNSRAPGEVLRWQAVVMNPMKIIEPGGWPDDVSVPKQAMKIAPFEDVEFEVKLEAFRDTGYSLNWSGSTAGVKGIVNIQVVADGDELDVNNMAGSIFIQSEIGHFLIGQTRELPYYVVLELDRTYRIRED